MRRALTLGVSQSCGVLQASAGGKKRKRKRVLKSKMFVDEEEGCMGKSGCLPHFYGSNFYCGCTEGFYGSASHGLRKRFRISQHHFVILLSTSCSQIEAAALSVKAWVEVLELLLKARSFKLV